MRENEIAQHMHEILKLLGLDPDNDEHLCETPMRYAKMLSELFRGLYEEQPELKYFEHTEKEDLVIVKDIPFWSMCAHHLLPFYGYAHVAYIPDKKIVGISKLARVVEHFARRPQVQERMTAQIADFIYTSQLEPIGVMVVVEAEHLCMIARGVQKPGSKTVTSAIRGVFRKEMNPREEVLKLLEVMK